VRCQAIECVEHAFLIAVERTAVGR
jgi:hypothetical protein